MIIHYSKALQILQAKASWCSEDNLVCS